VSCAEAAKPIDLTFGLWTRVGWRKHKFNCIRQTAPICPQRRTHWRHLANTTEPSVCGRDAVLRQTSLTTCYQGPCLLQMNMKPGSVWVVDRPVHADPE